MTQCKLCTRAAAVAFNKERSPMGPMWYLQTPIMVQYVVKRDVIMGTGRSAPESIRPKRGRSAPTSGTIRPKFWVVPPQHR